ncbi:MAG: hypothetical protein LBI87_02445 [Candidatus Accumulibacter sp.]|jgi:hypothetical protein|nr:hypothetical protein [Accumulibacter sp.]
MSVVGGIICYIMFGSLNMWAGVEVKRDANRPSFPRFAFHGLSMFRFPLFTCFMTTLFAGNGAFPMEKK